MIGSYKGSFDSDALDWGTYYSLIHANRVQDQLMQLRAGAGERGREVTSREPSLGFFKLLEDLFVGFHKASTVSP